MQITLIEADMDWGQRGPRRIRQWYVEGTFTREEGAEWVKRKMGWPRVNAAAFDTTLIELEKEYFCTQAHR